MLLGSCRKFVVQNNLNMKETNGMKIQLSAKETEVLRYISQGHTSNEIAGKMFLSVQTITTHRRNILRKTGAPNILAVVAVAIQQNAI